MAEVGQDHPAAEPVQAALEGQPTPPAEATSQTGAHKTDTRRVALNVSIALLLLIGAALLQTLSPFVKTAVGAASFCPFFVTWVLSLYNKDPKKDFKKEARSFLESRTCTWSLTFPAIAVWTVNASLWGLLGWTERQIKGEPVVLRIVPAKSVMQILDGARAGNGEPIVLRLHYRGKSTDYPLDGAGIIYMGSSKDELRAQFEMLDTDEKAVSDVKIQRSANLQRKLTQYLINMGVSKDDLDLWLTKWGSAQYLNTPVFRAGDEVGIDLVCTGSNKIMVHKPAFRLSPNQNPVYLECLEEPNPCVPPG